MLCFFKIVLTTLKTVHIKKSVKKYKDILIKTINQLLSYLL